MVLLKEDGDACIYKTNILQQRLNTLPKQPVTNLQIVELLIAAGDIVVDYWGVDRFYH